MKVAVTVRGEDLSAEIDPRFGRAAGFVIVDSDTGAFEYLDNGQNIQASQGAGVQSAQTVANAEVDSLLTGNCGPKAFMTLRAAGVEVFVGVSGTVSEALERLKRGELEPTSAANVDGHWM